MDRIEIGPADPGDVDFVRTLSAKVFARFGDYGTSLPLTMAFPWVRTVVARVEGLAVGFAMYSEEDLPRREIDLVAIAVDPGRQTRGIGRKLLAHVESETRALIPEGEAAVRLTVAEDNAVARGLFEKSGYVRLPGRKGIYPAGQRALTLRKVI